MEIFIGRYPCQGSACGKRHRKPGNRAKSRSSVIHSQPHSMARAAYQAAVTVLPRVFVSMHKRLKMSQCRSRGSTIWQCGCLSKSSQKPNAAESELGLG